MIQLPANQRFLYFPSNKNSNQMQTKWFAQQPMHAKQAFCKIVAAAERDYDEGTWDCRGNPSDMKICYDRSLKNASIIANVAFSKANIFRNIEPLRRGKMYDLAAFKHLCQS